MAFLPPTTSRGGRTSRQTAIRRTTAALPPTDRLTANITGAILASSPAEESEGLGWYAAAHRIAEVVAPAAHIGAGALAAVRPQTGWVDHVPAARTPAPAGSAQGTTPSTDRPGEAAAPA